MSGCVVPSDVGSALLISPGALNFGTTATTLPLDVSKNITTTPLGPIVVSSSADWLRAETCTDAAAGCDSIGPVDQVRIPITVDRSKMRLGANRALLTLQAAGASVQQIEVTANDPLETNFSVDVRNPEVGRAVNFTDLSATAEAGGIGSWLWSFGDGETSTLQNPVHVYRRAGVYAVSLTVTTATRTETRSHAAFVTVGSITPGADFTANQTTIFERESVSFTDTTVSPTAPVTAWLWSFGDGATSAEKNPIHQYDAPGVYTVALTVTTTLNGETVAEETATKTNFVLVQRRVAPRADFAVGQVKPFLNVPVQFTDLSVPGTSAIVDWVWEFGDGIISREASPVYTFTQVGVFPVKLTVASAHGVNSKTLEVEVVYKPPVADFSVSNTNPSTNTPVRFVDNSIPGSAAIVAWEWTFGDGDSSTAQNPEHTYKAAGNYTVRLTVVADTPTSNTSTVEKVAFVRVFDPPAPAFSFAPRSAFINEDVRFTNLTVPGTETQLTYLWDFDGDPETTTDQSVQQNPTRRFAEPGVYNTTLTARTPTRSVISAPQAVTVDRAPSPTLEASTMTPTTVTTVQFTDTTDTSETRPITKWAWTFGDGSTSNQQNPLKRYTTAGRYSVGLTVTFTHSATGQEFTRTVSRTNYINVSDPVPPTASFDVDNGCAMPGILVRFQDESTRGSGAIDSWSWNFGDGSTSNQQNPTHAYTNPGTYNVRLTVTTSQIEPPFNAGTITLPVEVANVSPTALDEYIRTPDPNYTFSEVTSFRVTAGSFALPATAYALRMTSQSWRNATEIYSATERLWTHNVTILVPDTTYRRTDTALLYIDGGSRSSSPYNANTLPSVIPQLALATGSVIAMVDNVPSQPLTFGDEIGLRSRSEDAIIAYSYDQYMNSVVAGQEDATWPVLLPMAKAAVRAMDTVQDFLPSKNVAPVEDFVVTGGSKRGWTTWLTGATDCRVRAIAPVVIDVLNMDEQMLHHRSVYGFWAPAIYDYAQERVFERLLPENGDVLPEAQKLLDIVDPYEYRDRITMPKFLLNSSGDQFFVPDSAQWYYDDLLGDKQLNYVPNTSHGIADIDGDAGDDPALNSLLAWYMSITQDIERPTFTWTKDAAAGRIVVTPQTGSDPVEVRLWQATNPDARDFRLDEGVNWTSTVLTAQGDGTYVGQVTPAPWTGFFVQMRYANPAEFAFSVPGFEVPDMVFTTEIVVTPGAYPDFVSYRDDTTDVPLVVLYGTPFEMGQAYGQLMSTEIAGLLASTFVTGSVAGAQLDAAWAAQQGAMDPRILDEIRGIAAGAGVSEAAIQRLHMVPVVEALYSADASAIWRGASRDSNGLLAYTLNGSRARAGQNFPCVVMYIPDAAYGIPHASITFAGLAYGWAGVNLGGIAVAETGDTAVANNFAGGRLHFLPKLRESLYDTTDLRQAWDVARVLSTKPDTFLYLDGRNENRGSKLTNSTTAPVLITLDDDDLDPLFPNVIEEVVYGGASNVAAFNFLGTNQGSINFSGVGNAASVQSLTRTLAAPGNNVLNLGIDALSFSISVSYGTSTTDASAAPFQTINLQGLLP
jgi:PKD repeat protein